MTGRHNYTSLTNGLAPQGPTQMNAIYAFWDQRVGESAANAAAFPAATARPPGHLIVANDTKALYQGDGAAWSVLMQPWTTYTPTLTNLSLGTGGVNSCEWRREGELIRVRFRFVLGTSGGSVSGIPTFTLPVTAAALQHDVVQYAGAASLYDVSATVGYSALVGAAPSSTTSARIILAGGTNGIYAPISSTAPFTWAANDAIAGEFTYKPA